MEMLCIPNDAVASFWAASVSGRPSAVLDLCHGEVMELSIIHSRLMPSQQGCCSYASLTQYCPPDWVSCHFTGGCEGSGAQPHLPPSALAEGHAGTAAGPQLQQLDRHRCCCAHRLAAVLSHPCLHCAALQDRPQMTAAAFVRLLGSPRGSQI